MVDESAGQRRQRRYRLHKSGIHNECLPGRGCRGNARQNVVNSGPTPVNGGSLSPRDALEREFARSSPVSTSCTPRCRSGRPTSRSPPSSAGCSASSCSSRRRWASSHRPCRPCRSSRTRCRSCATTSPCGGSRRVGGSRRPTRGSGTATRPGERRSLPHVNYLRAGQRRPCHRQVPGGSHHPGAPIPDAQKPAHGVVSGLLWSVALPAAEQSGAEPDVVLAATPNELAGTHCSPWSRS